MDYLRLVFYCYHIAHTEAYVRQHYATVFDNPEILTEPIGNISGGNKRRILVSSALLPNAELVILDEPYTGLDLLACRSLTEYLKAFKSGRLLLVSSHQTDYLSMMCDRVVVVGNGGLQEAAWDSQNQTTMPNNNAYFEKLLIKP